MDIHSIPIPVALGHLLLRCATLRNTTGLKVNTSQHQKHNEQNLSPPLLETPLFFHEYKGSVVADPALCWAGSSEL